MSELAEILRRRERLLAESAARRARILGYAVVLASSLDIQEVFTPNVKRWFDLISSRPAYLTAVDL